MIEKEISIKLGKNKINEEFNWFPNKEINPHLILIGGSGSGKTETLKKIIFELNIPSLIFDFHNDFSHLGKNIIDCDKIQINPLEIEIGETGLEVVYKFSNILKNVFGKLGHKQEAELRNSIKVFYENSNINLKEKNDGSFKIKPFIYFKDVLENECSKDKTLINKFSILFDFEVFSSDSEKDIIPFESMTNKTSVIKLNNFPNDSIKALVSEILLYKLINYSYKQGKRNLSLFCVIDEAHRLIYEGSPVELMMRESRKYGIGLLLASQRPTDFSENIFGNVGTIITLRTPLPKDINFISNIININKNDIAKITKAGVGYIKNSNSYSSEYLEIEPVEKNPIYQKTKEEFDEDEAQKRVEIELKEKKKELEIKENYEIIIKDNWKFKNELNEKNKLIEYNNIKIKNLFNKITEYKFEKTNLSTELNNMKNKNLELSTELNKVKNEKIDLKTKLNCLNTELNNVKNENSELNTELNNVKNEKTDLKTELNCLNNKLNKVKNENFELNNELNKVKNEKTDLKTELNCLKNERDFLKDKIEFIEEKLTSDIKTKFFIKDIDFSTEFN